MAHGSRDVRSQQSFQQLAALFRERVAQADITPQQIHTGTLEFNLPLEQQIQQIGTTFESPTELVILPLFLLPGTHVMSDIPQAVAVARQQLPKIQINLRPHLGSHPKLLELLRDGISPDIPWILLSHGSRYPGGNEAVEQLANTLGASPAYWSVSGSLEEKVVALSQQGHQKIGIFPYFLFSGSITDAISEQVDQLKCRFKELNLLLTSPINPSPALAQLLVDLI